MRRYLLIIVLLVTGLAIFAPPPAQAAGAPTRAFVFFTADSAALDEDAKNMVRRVARAARAAPSKTVRVLGFAAPDTGTPAFNHVLAEARAQNVADGLVAAGVPQRRVHIEARGAVPFEDMPTESRRVEIVIGD